MDKQETSYKGIGKNMQPIRLAFKGLYTNWNELNAPEGALSKARNINILANDLAEPRKGFDRLSSGYSNTLHRTDTTFFYEGKQFAHNGTAYSASTLSYFNAGTWNNLGTYLAPEDTKMKTLQSNGNLYFTTSTGIQKLDAYDASIEKAGAVKGLDLTGALAGDGSGFLANNERVAYRLVWGIKDANNNLILGAPSARLDISNTSGGSDNVDITATIPEGVTISWFYQLYRTTNYASSVEPNDELQLVYEDNPTAGEITAKSVTIADITSADLRGAALYTNASQEGLAFQNEQPPLAKDIAKFDNCAFFADTISKHRYTLTILSASGLANDDTITVDSVVYTAKASETVASGYFKLFTSGSESQNIRDTALSFCKVVNQYSSSTVYAYYLSGPNDLPGKILLEERDIGGSAFPINASNNTPLSPAGIPSSGSTVTSDNDTLPNGLAWSKPFQPESIPLVNRTQVGSRDSAILRIIPLEEALIIFKEEGIYRLTGSYPNFSVELMDSSSQLIGKETPAILNNEVFCLTTQGVCIINSQVRIISVPIENDIIERFSTHLQNMQDLAFGLGYETGRRYYLYLPTSASSTYPETAYVYNTFTKTWVIHEVPATCGVVKDTSLYFADATSNFLLQERNSGSSRDYVDYGFATTISAISDKTITITSGFSGVEVGDILFETSSKFAAITAVDADTNTFEVASNPGFTTTTVEIQKAIDTEIEWLPVTMGNPGVNKQIHTCTTLFKRGFSGEATLDFSTDISPSTSSVTLAGTNLLGWGLTGWGTTPWGDVPVKKPIRQLIPRLKQRCNWLTVGFRHSYGYSDWNLQGITLHGSGGSEKTSK